MQLSAESVGYLAAGLTTASFFPQAVKTLRSGDTKAICLGTEALITLIPAALVLQRKLVERP